MGTGMKDPWATEGYDLAKVEARDRAEERMRRDEAASYPRCQCTMTNCRNDHNYGFDPADAEKFSGNRHTRRKKAKLARKQKLTATFPPV